MEQVLLVFAIVLLIWLGTGASRQARTPESHAMHRPHGQASDPPQ